MATLQTRDWAHLPPELLQTITAHLPHLPDLLRFAAVCSPWRSAAKSAPGPNLPQQLPWLLLPKHSTADATRSFFNLSDHRTYSLPLPESRKTRTNQHFPSPSGRIVSPHSIQTLALLNPLTRSSVELPPLPLTESRRKNIGAYVLRKAKLFGPDLVAVLFPDGRDILFCRAGDSSWKRMDMFSCYPYEDFAFYDGRFFVISGISETIWVFDVETLEKVAEIPLVEGAKVCDYLVELPSGELLLVRRKHGDERKRFELFRFEERGEEAEWVEVSDIGDAVLFVDGLQVMAFAVGDFSGWRGNCVYYVDKLCGPGQKGVLVFDIGKGQIDEEPVFCFTSRGHWGKAVWVVLSLE